MVENWKTDIYNALRMIYFTSAYYICDIIIKLGNVGSRYSRFNGQKFVVTICVFSGLECRPRQCGFIAGNSRVYEIIPRNIIILLCV